MFELLEESGGGGRPSVWSLPSTQLVPAELGRPAGTAASNIRMTSIIRSQLEPILEAYLE